MLHRLQQFFFVRQMKKLIKTAIEFVYAEQFDFNILAEQLIDQYPRVNLIRIFAAICVAAETKLGAQAQYNDFFDELRLSELSVQDLEDYQSLLDLYKARAELGLSKVKLEFTVNQFAPEYSYQDILNRAEKAKKGPLSFRERENIRELADEIYNLDCQVENLEQKVNVNKISPQRRLVVIRQHVLQKTHDNKKSSKEKAEEVFEKIKDEVEAERKIYGSRSKEDLAKEREELISQLKEIVIKPKNDSP